MTRKAILLLGCVALFGGGVAAQRGTVTLEAPPSFNLHYLGPLRGAAGGNQPRVVGTVIDIRQVPVARVSVRLRNLITGEVIAVAESDENGAYAFPETDPGSFIVEMFLGDRYVVAASNAGSVGRDETLQTVIQLPGRWDTQRQTVLPPTNVDFLGKSSTQSMASETIIIASGQEVRPANPGEPVSPVR